MKFERIEAVKMKNDEHFQFITEFRDAIIKFDPQTLKVKPLFEQFLELYKLEDEVHRPVNKSILTEEINEADQLRDQLFRGMALGVETASYHFREDVINAAKHLEIIFDTYGNIAKLPKNEATSAIYNLIQEINKDENMRYAELINLEEWLPELEKANEKIDRLIKRRYEESAGKSDYSMREIRTQVDVNYKKIIEIIEAYCLIEEQQTGVGWFTNFIKYMNVIIEKYNAIIAQRYGRNKNEEGNEDNN